MPSIKDITNAERELSQAEEDIWTEKQNIFKNIKLLERLKEAVDVLTGRYPLDLIPPGPWFPGQRNPYIAIKLKQGLRRRVDINVTADNERLSVRFSGWVYNSYWTGWEDGNYTYELPLAYKISDLDLGAWFSWLLNRESEPWEERREFLVKLSKNAWKNLIKSLPKTEAEEFKERKKELLKK